MFTYDQFKTASVAERKSLISEQTSLETSPEGMTEQHRFSFTASKVINRVVSDFIDEQIASDLAQNCGSDLLSENLVKKIDDIFKCYEPSAIEAISKLRPTVDELQKKPKNLYELAGATELAFANRVSRNISTTMGPLWEQISKVSPYVINPETDFGTKIAGVDIILKNASTGQIEYAQLKTKRDTLSGSHKGRVETELSLHDFPIFCACIDTKSTWTFSTKKNIPRLAGKEFWDRIGIEYSIVTGGLSGLVLSLEDSFIKMLRDHR